MNDTERYLAALDPPDPQNPAADGHYWPDGIPTPADEKPEHPLDYQFLSNDGIGHYFAGLGDQPAGKPNSADRHRPVRIDFAALGRQWTAETFPLVLCEFLAYKAGLAYRSPRQIRHDLLGIDTKGRPYIEGVDQFAFFDTSQPGSTVRYADTQAYVFVHERTGYLIFRGTSSFSDWYTNLSFKLRPIPTRISKPFRRRWSAPSTQRATPASRSPGAALRPTSSAGFAISCASRMDKVVLSGHSLGGALAILGAHDFAKEQICPVHAVITFGAPKVGGPDFKAEYESPPLGLKDRTLRIEASEDAVSVLARRWNDVHVGHAWRFKKRPLRPSWQMMLFSPLIDAQAASQKKLEEIDAQSTNDSQTQSTTNSSAPPNAPREEQLTWQQYFMSLLWMVLWYLLKTFVRALAAHSVETRYGLYLSTLSYRRIRK